LILNNILAPEGSSSAAARPQATATTPQQQQRAIDCMPREDGPMPFLTRFFAVAFRVAPQFAYYVRDMGRR